MFCKTRNERPILAMQRWYVEHPDLHDRTFLEDYDALAVFGYVLSTPKLFIAAHPVRHDADVVLIENPMHVFPEDALNNDTLPILRQRHGAAVIQQGAACWELSC